MSTITAAAFIMGKSDIVKTAFVVAVAVSSLPFTSSGQIETLNAYPSLTFSRLTDLQSAPDNSGRLFVLEQPGVIRVIQSGSPAMSSVFLDIQSRVTCCGEEGLLGMAFSPQYSSDGLFYVFYTTSQESQIRIRVSEFVVSASNSNVADLSSERIVLEIPKAGLAHNGGQIAFGPDGYLYIAVGDGGGIGDPDEHGQNVNTLFGTILRINPGGQAGGGSPKSQESFVSPDCGGGTSNDYSIPASNAFVGTAGCDEIYAYGFRNPWRFSFDSQGRLWVGDVGQDQQEEIDWVVAGDNYGWDTMEGDQCHEPVAGCSTLGLTMPVLQYTHEVGYSVTGGHVYDGILCPQLDGKYVYADFVTGEIWAASFDANGITSNELIVQSGRKISTFGIAPDGELLVGFYSPIGDEIHAFSCSFLPVEVAGFDATVSGKGVEFTWRSLTESDITGFAVDGRREDADWAELGQLTARGHIDEPMEYRLSVPQILPGVHTFRLRSFDRDGSSAVLAEVDVEVKWPTNTLGLEVYPNPSSGPPAILFALGIDQAAVRLEIYDILGRHIRTGFSGPVSGNRIVRVSLADWQPQSGVYVARLTSDYHHATTSFVVVR